MTRRYALQNNNLRNTRGGPTDPDSEGTDSKVLARKRPAGLVNLGNTCFMNAALQCLSRTPNLQNRLEMLTGEPNIVFSGSALTYNNENQGKEELQFKLTIPQDSVIRKMVALLHQMTEGSGATVNPRQVHHLMTRNFGAGLQHDSHELLRHVLDKLKKDQIKAFRVALMKKFEIPLEEGAKLSQSDPQKANMVKEWDRKLYNTTVIDDVFGGELLTTRTCLECNAVKTSCEEFLDISLPIRVVKSGSQNNHNVNNRFSVWNEVTTINRTLQECFQCFTEPETLSGNNKVDCEKCHEAKLNQLKAGVPVEQVFPPGLEEEQQKRSFSSHNQSSNKFRSQQQQQQQLISKKKQQNPEEFENPQPPQKSSRKKKRRRTRKDKIAEDPFPAESQETPQVEQERSENENNPEIKVAEEAKAAAAAAAAAAAVEAAEQEKIPDEGYAEDFKESDDSTTDPTSGPEQPNEEEEDEEEDEEAEDEEVDNSNEADKEQEITPEKKVQHIPKSTKTPCRRQTMIYKPPTNLTIHLKRFTVSTRGFAQKLADHVKFQEYINIRDYVTTSLPSVEDHEPSQNNSANCSWSLEELVPKETDMLGGASGDSTDLRQQQEEHDSIIRQPSSTIPLLKFSADGDNSPGDDDGHSSPADFTPLIDELLGNDDDSSARQLKSSPGQLNSSSDQSNSSTDHLNSSSGVIINSASSISDAKIPITDTNSLISDAPTPISTPKAQIHAPKPLISLRQAGANNYSSSQTNMCLHGGKEEAPPQDESTNPVENSLLQPTGSLSEYSQVENSSEENSRKENQNSRKENPSEENSRKQNPSAGEGSSEGNSPRSDNVAARHISYDNGDNSTDNLEESTFLMDDMSSPPAEFPIDDDDDEDCPAPVDLNLSFDYLADEEEPPPYPGSPIPLDDDTAEAPRIDVTNPFSTEGTANWREYKTQDIVQWSFKSEEEEEELEDQPQQEGTELTTMIPINNSGSSSGGNKKSEEDEDPLFISCSSTSNNEDSTNNSKTEESFTICSKSDESESSNNPTLNKSLLDSLSNTRISNIPSPMPPPPPALPSLDLWESTRKFAPSANNSSFSSGIIGNPLSSGIIGSSSNYSPGIIGNTNYSSGISNYSSGITGSPNYSSGIIGNSDYSTGISNYSSGISNYSPGISNYSSGITGNSRLDSRTAEAATVIPPPPSSEVDNSKIAIPLGYSSLLDHQGESEPPSKDIISSYGPFLEETVLLEEEETEPEFETDPNGINYRLYGIVEHGGSLNWGHYVAYIRVGSDWYYVSDSYVSRSDISTVLSRDPYILFYERVP